MFDELTFAPGKKKLPALLEQWSSEFTALRRDIHKHPELSFQEHRTAQLVADHLSSWGIEVTTGIGQTGVVGSLKRGRSSRAIGLRADMDALAMDENNRFAHRSVNEGCFHGCGHDGHTTMLLAAARYLAQEVEFDGCVQFIFQPAEEGAGGAMAMIEDGLFQRFPVEAVYGLHNAPGVPEGAFVAVPGAAMASFDQFDLQVKGLGGHAAVPQTAIDPIPILSQIITAWQTIVSRNIDPFESAVISTTQLNAGSDTYNVIPETAHAAGCTRSLSPTVRDSLEQRMTTIAHGITAAHDAQVQFDYIQGYPVLINSPEHTDLCQQVASDVVGPGQVSRSARGTMGSEDFAAMLQEKPGCYIFLGNGDGESSCMVHNPDYDFNDNIIPVGAAYWARLVETALL